MPSISIVIPTYKRGSLLRHALYSALQQTLPATEIIVVDDNRDAAETSLVTETLGSLRDPRIKYIRNFRQPGGCGARNAGILSAEGDLIAFLDDDDTLFPDALQLHYNAMDDNTDMVYGNCQVEDLLYKVTETTGFQRNRLRFKDLIMGECPPSTSCVMARKTVLLETGLFDESLPSFQDYDMWLRIARDHSIHSHPGLVARFIQHDGSRTSINFDKRKNGLNLIVDKWKKDISMHRSIKGFTNHFLAGAYFNSGALSLALGDEHRAQAFRYFTKALRLKWFHRRYWKWTAFSLLGFQMTKKIRSIHP